MSNPLEIKKENWEFTHETHEFFTSIGFTEGYAEMSSVIDTVNENVHELVTKCVVDGVVDPLLLRKKAASFIAPYKKQVRNKEHDLPFCSREQSQRSVLDKINPVRFLTAVALVTRTGLYDVETQDIFDLRVSYLILSLRNKAGGQESIDYVVHMLLHYSKNKYVEDICMFLEFLRYKLALQHSVLSELTYFKRCNFVPMKNSNDNIVLTTLLAQYVGNFATGWRLDFVGILFPLEETAAATPRRSFREITIRQHANVLKYVDEYKHYLLHHGDDHLTPIGIKLKNMTELYVKEIRKN